LLPEHEIPLRIHDGRIVPCWLSSKDHRWLERLLDIVATLVGRSRDEVDEALRQRPELGETQRSWKSAARLATGLARFETTATMDPILVRKSLFTAAAGRPVSNAAERATIVADVAEDLGVTADDVERALYADLPGRRVFRMETALPGPAELVDRVNLAIGQALLLRATSIRVRVTQNLEALLRMARLTRLLCWATEDPSGQPGAILGVSGPLSLFRRTLVYGRALSSWLPVLVRTRGWSLVARCELRGQRASWHADHRDPLVAGRGLLRRFDSRVEEALFRGLGQVVPDLQVFREAHVVRSSSGRLVAPDFVVVDRRTGRKACVEIVGYWTPQYLQHKIETLRSLGPDTRWILCVDQSLALDGASLPDWPILPYRRRIDPSALAQLLSSQLTPPS
jgi:uncharacterized protein